jgi:micrococcal nuclease
MYTYRVKLVRVIDGNTIDAEINLGFNVVMRQRIKLYGIATHGIHTKDNEERERGMAAKQRLTEILPKEFIVETILNKRGKVGRIMGILHIEEHDERININDAMVEEGHAVRYNDK